MNFVYSVGEVSCALEVEPRISAKSKDNSICAPPAAFKMNCSQPLHKRGESTDERMPITGPMILKPTPPRGALHWVQRGLPGSTRKRAASTARKRLNPSGRL